MTARLRRIGEDDSPDVGCIGVTVNPVSPEFSEEGASSELSNEQLVKTRRSFPMNALISRENSAQAI